MKRMFLLLAIACADICQAQTNTEDVLTVEKRFAAYSVEKNTKAAFLQFLDSTGVVFEKGKVLNGIETWTKKNVNPGVLNWHPLYGVAAKSGDIGFTTGPWTFQPKTIHDSIVARGQYATIWKKNSKGEWKFIVDMGISNTPPFNDSAYQFGEAPVSFVKGTWNNLLNKEQQFIQRTKNADHTERLKWYTLALSRNAFFLNRNNQLPAVKSEEVARTLITMPATIDYTIEGSGISEAGDLGYIYGTTNYNGKTDNYLRIWRREGIAWKLVLEVLPY
jgi:hypothetical protein